MAALSITSLVSFFGNEQKSLTRGENHYKSNHVESFTYSDGIIRGEVHASMKKNVYKVTVSSHSKLRLVVSMLFYLHTPIKYLWLKLTLIII